MKYLHYFTYLLDRFFVLFILVVAGLAMLLPVPFIELKSVKILDQSLIVIGLMLIMFVMGLSMSKNDFKIIFLRPRDVFIGVLAQFSIMPFVAFFLSKLFSIPPEFAVGLVLLGACPGGTASNVMTYLAKGDLALSIGMTTATTLLAPLLTPVLTYYLADNWLDININTMFLAIIKIVVLPISFGMLIHYYFGKYLAKLKRILVIIPIISILLIMAMSVAPNKENLLNASFVLLMVIALHNWIGFFFGYIIGYFTGMNTNRKKALSLEIGLQNSGLSIGLAGQFSNPLVALPSVIATVIHQISGSILAYVYSKLK